MGPVFEGAEKEALRRLLHSGGKVSTVDQNHKTSRGFKQESGAERGSSLGMARARGASREARAEGQTEGI